MEIILFDSRGNTFAKVTNWDKANEATKAIFKRNYWSDLYYDISFSDGTQVSGSIDLEPQTFHKPHQKSIFTTHLQTFWTNISNTTPKPYLSQSDIDFCKKLLNYLPKN